MLPRSEFKHDRFNFSSYFDGIILIKVKVESGNIESTAMLPNAHSGFYCD